MPANTIGYARTAVADQDISGQIEALNAAGCFSVYMDQGVSGSLMDRPGFAQALAVLADGDTLKVCSLDRIARSVTEFSELRKHLAPRQIQIIALDLDQSLTPDMVQLLAERQEASAEHNIERYGEL